MFLLSTLTIQAIRKTAIVGRTLCVVASNNNGIVENLQQCLNISRPRAEHIVLKHPSVSKYDVTQIRQVVKTVLELGMNQKELAEEPLLFSNLPVTLRYRYQILKECGFHAVTASNLSKYLNLVRKKTIADLKSSGLILPVTKVESRLAEYFTQWPTSRSVSVRLDEKSHCLQYLRMKVLQRYLELVIDLPETEFEKALNRYVRIRHRPLDCINETLMLLQKNILMPNEKIRSNLFLIHADPDHIKEMLYEVRHIAGVDIKDILKMYPKLCTTNVQTIRATQKLLDEYGVKKEAQVRCFEIFTLSTETVRQRLKRAESIPEFKALRDNPRMLRLIHYEKKALKRIESLHKTNKKCLSLNILSGSSAHYNIFEKAPGDRTKGSDLVFGIAEEMGSKFTPSDVREIMKRHPFWINIPLVHAKLIYDKLSSHFSSAEILENCPILFYPWEKIESLINIFTDGLKTCNSEHMSIAYLEHLNLSKLTKSQILSLILYVLEKEHYFSGNGMWTVGQLKNEIYTLDQEESLWTNYSNRQLQNSSN